MEVELPDGRVLEFPDGTSESVMRAAIGRLLGGPPLSGTQGTATPPSAADRARADMRSRATVVEEFPSGGRIYRSAGGVESYVGPDGAAESDPAVIEMMRRTQDPDRVLDTKFAKDLIGEKKTRALSLMKGVQGLRGYVGQLAEFGANQSGGEVPEGNIRVTQSLIDAAIEGRGIAAPKTVAASRLAMGAGLGALAIPAMPAATMVGKIAQGAAIGGPMAAIEGLIGGYGEGGPEEAISQAKTGATFGTAFGMGGPIVGRAAGSVATNYLKKPITSILEELGFGKEAGEVVRDVVRLDSATAAGAITAAKPYATIANSGAASAALLDEVANNPATRGVVLKNLDETAALASNDLTASLNTNIGSPFGDLKEQLKKIMADTAEARRELYGRAYDFEITPDTDAGAQLMSTLNRVNPSDIAGARRLMRESGEPWEQFESRVISADDFNDIPPAKRAGMDVTGNPDGTYTIAADPPPVMAVDYLSRQLYDESEALARAGNMAAANSKRDLALRLRSELDAVNPDYAAARAAGRDAIESRKAAELGDKILNPKITRAEVEREVSGMGPTERTELVRALRNKIDEYAANVRVNPLKRGSDGVEAVDVEATVEALATLKVLNSRAVSTKLRMVLGDEAADALSQQVRDTSSALATRAGVAANSATYIRNAVSKRVDEIVGSNLGERIAEQGPINLAVGGATQALLGGEAADAARTKIMQSIAGPLSRRIDPANTDRVGQLMQSIAPAANRAQAGGQSFGNAAQRAMMGAGVSGDAAGPESNVERLKRQFGLN
tara:strand:+ start:6 stop:2363 length:2358 start_codon:yes stop_codon:yes gene_type:complete